MKDKFIDKSKLKILVCCHKPCDLPEDELLLPVHVGASLSDADFGMQRDDMLFGKPCDNISAKNKTYCEITAIYWAWKNIKKLYPDLEYIGLNHYRRFFAFEKSFFDIYACPEPMKASDYCLDKTKLSSALQHSRACVAKPKVYKYSLATDYCVHHVSDDYRKLKNIVYELYPSYEDSFKEVMEQNNKLSHYNMFILRWDDFDAYCTWLFSILTEVEKVVDVSSYTDVQKRVFGYMAERLLNVWLYHNKIKTKRIPVYWFVDRKMPSVWKYRATVRLNNLGFNKSMPLRVHLKFLLYKFKHGETIVQYLRRFKREEIEI